MSSIQQLLLYTGLIGEKYLSTTFDPSSKLSCISSKNLKGLTTANLLGRTRVLGCIEIKQVVLLDFYINNVLLSDEFFVIPGLKEEMIIGAPTIRKWRIKLNHKTNQAEVDPKVAKMQLI